MDLEKIMKSVMKIRERPDKPVRASFTIMLKGQIVFSRCYDDSEVLLFSNFLVLLMKLGWW